MECRSGCGACCIAPSISTPMPGLPFGKAANERCPHLDSVLRCQLFGCPERPAVCSALRPEPEMCQESPAEALRYLLQLELATQPLPV